MTSPWYNPTFVARNTRALAEAINNELAKIKAAFDQLPPPGSVGTGTSPVYTHFAYSDAADGTRNFTTGSPGNRRYIGVQANVTSSTPSEFPSDYAWSLLTSGVTSGAPDDDLIADINQALQQSSDAITAAAAAQGTADGKVTTFFQNNAPVAEAEGDLWIDTNDGNLLYRWNGSAWTEVQDAAIGQAITAASTAQATADGKIVSFYQDDPPTAGTVGDLWVDTNDSNRLYRWSGSAWVSARDAGIAKALVDAATAITNAATAQATADGKVTTFLQDAPPSADGVGDLWIDTNDGNRLYRWSGSSWNVIQDAGIAQAIVAASTAQSTADGKIETFYQASPPTAGAVGDLWIDTDNDNLLHRWSGSAWVTARDAGIAVAQQLASDAEAAATAAQSSANTANSAIAAITNDNLLSADEKPEIRKQRDAVLGEYGTIRARAIGYSISVVTYDARYNDLINYLGGLGLTTAANTAINRTTFNTRFTDYFNARQVVLDNIAAAAAERATWSNVTGSGRPADNATRNTGALADLDQVGTSRITANAVTSVSSAFTAGDITVAYQPTYSTLQSVAVTTLAGSDVLVFANAAERQRKLGSTTLLGAEYRVTRNGTVVYGPFEIFDPEPSAEVKGFRSIAFNDTPGAGTHTYRLECRRTGGVDGYVVSSQRTLTVVETKR